MFAPSRQTSLFEILGDCPPSSSEALPARTSARPIPKAKASTARAPGSISRPPGSSETAALVGSLLKTALICELAAPTGCSARWKLSATPAGRSWYVLETSAPTTNVRDPGSSVATPTSSRAIRSAAFAEGRVPSVREALLPTPLKRDAAGGPRYDPDGTRGMSLREVMSPKALDAWERLPTPTKRDGRMDAWSPAYDRRHSPTMDAVMSGAMMSLTPTKTANHLAPSMTKWTSARALAAMLLNHGLAGTAALPVTYGWMMGFPPGWLARALLSAAAAGRLPLPSSSKPSATPSCRKSRKP